MAEALGVASSMLAISTVALGLSKSTYEIISSFRSQRQDIRSIQSDSAALVVILQAIHKQAEASPDDVRLEALMGPLSCCETILREIHDSLAECTRFTKDHRESVRTWLKLRFREKTFIEMKERLSSYKSTLCIAFDTMNMHDRQTTRDSLDELTKLTDCTREELEDQLDHIEEQISAAENSLRAVLETDRAQLQSCLRSLERAQAERTTKAQIVISDNTAVGPDTRLIAGTDASAPTFDLSVTHNRAEAGASMAAGVHRPEVLLALLQQSAAPASVVSIVQTMQMGNLDPQSPAVQELLQRQAGPPRSVSAAIPRTIEGAHESPVRMFSLAREHEDGVTR